MRIFVRPDAVQDHARRETLDSLLDGRAKWPDGSARQVRAPLYDRMAPAPAEFEIVMPDGRIIGPLRGPRELRLCAESLPGDDWEYRVVGCE